MVNIDETAVIPSLALHYSKGKRDGYLEGLKYALQSCNTYLESIAKSEGIDQVSNDVRDEIDRVTKLEKENK